MDDLVTEQKRTVPNICRVPCPERTRTLLYRGGVFDVRFVRPSKAGPRALSGEGGAKVWALLASNRLTVFLLHPQYSQSFFRGSGFGEGGAAAFTSHLGGGVKSRGGSRRQPLR